MPIARHQAQRRSAERQAPLFVGEEEDGEDVIRMLEAYKKAFSDEIKVFQLQRRITELRSPSAPSSTAKNSSRG